MSNTQIPTNNQYVYKIKWGYVVRVPTNGGIDQTYIPGKWENADLVARSVRDEILRYHGREALN
jgi:hypothetical protein